MSRSTDKPLRTLSFLIHSTHTGERGERSSLFSDTLVRSTYLWPENTIDSTLGLLYGSVPIPLVPGWRLGDIVFDSKPSHGGARHPEPEAGQPGKDCSFKRRNSGEPQENLRSNSGGTQEELRRTSGEPQEDLKRISGGPQEDLRRISGGSQEDLRRTSGGTQEELRRTSGGPQAPWSSLGGQEQQLNQTSSCMGGWRHSGGSWLCYTCVCSLVLRQMCVN